MRFRELGEEKKFKTAVTVLLAGLTILGSLIVILNNRAAGLGAEAGRDSRLLGIRYLTHLGRSLWESAAEKKLMISWQELGGLMMQADAYENMSRGVDASLYRISRERLAKVRDLLAEQGVVTKAPYFNGPAGAFDFAQYAYDRIYIPAAELLERQDQRKRQGGFWNAKSDAYSAGLAVLAVAVFLLTLSLVLAGRIRFGMAGAGLALILAVSGIAAATALRTWRGPSDESIKALAAASASVMRAQLILDAGGDMAGAKSWADRAKADLEAILVRDPGYLGAELLRSLAEKIAGETLYYDGRVAEGRAALVRAMAGIDRVIRSGRDDGYILWSRGYGELLLGRPHAAVLWLDKALAALPDLGFALGTVKSVALLAAGKKAEAGAALETAVSLALEHPLASNPIYSRTIIRNLERWNEVARLEGLEAMILRLKEAAVCVAVLHTARPKETAAQIAPPRFVDPVYDSHGEIIAYPACQNYPRFTARAHFQLELKGMVKGQSIVSKVFWKSPGQAFWIEQLRLGKTQHWDGPDAARLLGFVANPMPEAGEILVTGEYRLEIYVEGGLKAVATFNIR